MTPRSAACLFITFVLGAIAPAMALEGVYTIETAASNGLNVGLNKYLPAGYSDPVNATKRYPLWVFLGGAGEIGDPNSVAVVLDKTTRWGPSKEIRYNNRDYPCIVVTPCSVEWQDKIPNFYNAMVEFLKTHERVDPDRIYFSGLCTGAGGVMEYGQIYPDQLAAILPVITQSSIWNPGRLAKVPAWMFHGYGDTSVERIKTIEWANAIANTQVATPGDCMANYPYSYTPGGSPRMNAVDQTASFTPAAGWKWVPGIIPTPDTLLRFTLYSTNDHEVWQSTINNPTVLHWLFRQHRKTAFAGTPVAIPGHIECERFDLGGPDLAYHETTSANTGGSPYRQVPNAFDGTSDDDEVDLASISSDGVALTGTEAGEWLDYTVNAASGTYALTLRLSAATPGGALHFTANGLPITGTISVPATPGYIKLVVPGVTLTPGIQTVRLVVDAGGFAVDWFEIGYPPGPADLVVDNLDSDRVTTTGAWTLTNYTPGFYGADYLSAAPGSAATATFRPTLPRTGWYEVFTQYPANASRGIAAVSVRHGNGSDVYATQVDQRQGGGAWQSLGVFDFDAGNAGSVIISSLGATGYVSADAVRFLERDAPPPIDLIVDNQDGARVATTGPWSQTNYTPGFYGPDYLSAPPGSNATAVFRPNLPRAGFFKVYVQYPANGSRGISPITIAHEDGSALFQASVDQRTNGGAWFFLGAFHFAAGSGPAVTIRSLGAGGYVSADAVRFQQVEALPTIDLIVDNSDGSRVSTTGPWSLTNYTPGFFATDYLSAAPGSNSTAVFRPNLTRAGNFQVFVQYPANSSRGVSPITVAHENGSVLYETAVDQRFNGGAWFPIGAFHFEAGAGPSVTIRSLGATGYVSADAVRFVQVDTLPAIDQIVDNADSARVTIIGAWSPTSFTPGYYGPDYVSAAPSIDKRVIFRPNLTRAATVDISIWYPSTPSRGTTPVTIAYGDGTLSTVINVDQSSNGGQWRFLGTFPIEAGSAPIVTVGSFASGGWISADAVRFKETVISGTN